MEPELFALLLRPRAPSMLARAPSLLPLKRPCSLSRSDTAIPNLKVGVHIIHIYIYVTYVPNLGLEISIPGWESEHVRFRDSSKGAHVGIEGPWGSTEGAWREYQGSRRGAARRHSKQAQYSLDRRPHTLL